MGFRTLAMSADYASVELPAWFVEKYQKGMHLCAGRADKKTLPIASKVERKFYAGKEDELFVDFQRLLRELPEEFRFHKEDGIEFVLFHECGGISKVNVGADFIRMYEPEGWREVDEVGHGYGCHECSRV